MTDTPEDDERAEAIRFVQSSLGDVFAQFRRLVKRNAELLQPGLHPATFKMFTVIARHAPVTASTLAGWLDLDKSQVSRAVRDLEEAGLVTRRPDESDRRSFVIEPTESGRTRLAAVRTRQEQSLHSRLADWPVEDVHRLGELLHALTEQDPLAED